VAESDLDAETLRRMYLDEEMTITAIARALRVRKQTVCAALSHWDIPRRRSGPRRHLPDLPFTQGELRRLVARKGVRTIAHNLGVVPDVIYIYLHREPQTRGVKRIADDEAIWAAYQARMSITEISIQFQCARNTIKRSLRRSFLRTATARNQ
jgi:lambda repressor-like predicted transcriptional regulator